MKKVKLPTQRSLRAKRRKFIDKVLDGIRKQLYKGDYEIRSCRSEIGMVDFTTYSSQFKEYMPTGKLTIQMDCMRAMRLGRKRKG